MEARSDGCCQCWPEWDCKILAGGVSCSVHMQKIGFHIFLELATSKYVADALVDENEFRKLCRNSDEKRKEPSAGAELARSPSVDSQVVRLQAHSIHAIPQDLRTPLFLPSKKMSGAGYDVVVDVDEEVSTS